MKFDLTFIFAASSIMLTLKTPAVRMCVCVLSTRTRASLILHLQSHVHKLKNDLHRIDFFFHQLCIGKSILAMAYFITADYVQAKIESCL